MIIVFPLIESSDPAVRTMWSRKGFSFSQSIAGGFMTKPIFNKRIFTLSTFASSNTNQITFPILGNLQA